MYCKSLLLVLATLSLAQARTVYVSLDGDDSYPGTREAPLRTLAGARDRVSVLKSNGQPMTIQFDAGTYRFDEAAEFGMGDSGTPDQAIVYQPAPNARVVFSGAKIVTGWQLVTDAAVLEQLEPVARDQVQVANLRDQGIRDYGSLAVRGFGKGSPPAEMELFCNNLPMTLARWPNEGFRGAIKKHDLQTVEIDTDRLQRWADESDPWIFAYWHHDWAELYEPIVGMEPEKRIIRRSPEIKPQYGVTAKRSRWYALNLLSELDQPGEYYLDRKQGLLYFWPPEAIENTTLSQSIGIIQANRLSHVTFQGFTIEACRGTAISMQNGTGCTITGCTIRNVGHRAVVVNGGDHQTVFGCDITYCGEGGISMSGGDRPTLTPGAHNAENNHIHHYSRRARTYKCAISVSGVGNRIAHNLIHDGPHMALSASGNDHIVEYNEIHNVVYESGDAGAFYVGRDWTQRGTTIRYNYFHQIVGGTGYGGMTIYLDDQHCGYHIYGNLFERCSQTIFIGGGDDNHVTNNVFINCWRAAHVDNRGMGWQKKATDDPNGTLRTRLRAMPYQNALWSERYPTLPGILADQPNIPKRNVFRSNVSAGGLWNHIYESIRQYQSVERNLVFDNDSQWIRLIRDEERHVTTLVCKDPAALTAIDFEPIPLRAMGVYQSTRRASWPVSHEVRVVALPDSPLP